MMSFILPYIEYALGSLLSRRRGYDDDLFFKGPAFENFPKPTFEVTSPDCGPTGGKLSTEYSQFGSSRVPRLSWPAAGSDVKEYVIVSEDPDVPLGHSSVHGIYCFVPPTKTSFGPEDLELAEEAKNGMKKLKSGYRVGQNRRNVVYIAPRPPRGHGPHRYFFEIVALSQQLDREKLSDVPTKQELSDLIVGKVCGWGVWQASYEAEWH